MSAVELRPLSLGELLDRAFSLYRRNLWLFVGIMLIPSCLIVPVRFYFLRARGSPFPWGRTTPQPHLGGYGYAIIFASWLLYSIVNGALTCAVAEVLVGRGTTIQGAFGKVRGRILRIIGLVLNVGIRVAGFVLLLALAGAISGAILAVILGGGGEKLGAPWIALIVGLGLLGFGFAMWISMRYAIAIPAMLLENIKGRAAIRRSVQLSRGRRNPLFLSMLLTVVITYAGVIVFQGPFYLAISLMNIRGRLPTWMALCLSASGSVGGAITSPLLMIVLVLFYYDLRIRKEAFDLQFMMSSLPDPKPANSNPAT
jgi:Membrane domain of glycerophosphoryl diester phosphodiesterase